MDSSICKAFTIFMDLEGGGDQKNLSNRCNLMLILVGILILVVVSVILVTKRKSKKRDGRFLWCMSLSEIKKATKGFHRDRIIGGAAYSIVYQGVIPSYGKVAIKRFCPHSKASNHIYSRELSACLTGVTHSNIVKLIGWCECDQKNELILVYEFMSNGSLDQILHSSLEVLTWEKRVDIVLGVASALVYLHHQGLNPVIHGDVNTFSIMIDSEFNAKLGHLGHAIFLDNDRGTKDGTTLDVPTVKTDVYNFGVVVLELVTGRRRVEDDDTKVTDWVWELWAEGKLTEAADRRLDGNAEMDRMLKVGLWCVHPNPTERPNLREAVKMILGERAIPPLPPRKPTVRIETVY